MRALTFPAAHADSAPRFVLRTLGAFELLEQRPAVGSGDDSANEAVPILGPGKPLALLVYCTCLREQKQSRDHLAGLLWAESPPDRARHNVRQAIWRLRRLLGDVIVTDDEVIASIGTELVSDYEAFTNAVQRQDGVTALALYGGPFLSGASLPGGDDFEEWAAIERRRLAQSLLRVVEPTIRGLITSDRPSQAREALERLVQVAAEQRDAHRMAIESYLALGDRTAARRAADRLEQLSEDELESLTPIMTALITRARDVDGHTDGEGPGDGLRTITMDLVGRDETFAQVMRAWSAARQGETRVITLNGVAGVGKTRLLNAIAARCSAKGRTAVLVRAAHGERHVPFSLAASMARALSSRAGALGVTAESARELVALDPGLAGTYSTTPSSVDGGESVRRRALALLDLLSAVAEESPLALLIDDLHWCDPASQQLLDIVIGRATALPLLLVMTARGTLSSQLSHPAEQRIPLLPLDQGALVEAIHSVGTWPDDGAAAAFISALANASGGIPLGVVERLTWAIDKGLIAEQDGVFRARDWAHAASEIAVASPLDHRLLACGDVERRVLLLLSVAGTSLSGAIIADAVEPSQTHVVFDALLSLEAKGLLVREEAEWSPSHDLVLERMLALSTPDEQKRLHLALGDALLRADAVQHGATALRHYVHAHDDARAAQVFAQMVRRARAARDTRPVREMLRDVTAESLTREQTERLVRAVPAWQRGAVAHRGRVVMAMAALVVAVGAGMWWSRRMPAVTVIQAPIGVTNAPTYGDSAYRMIPPLIVRVNKKALAQNGIGDSTGSVVRVRPTNSTTQILAGGTAIVKDGIASFGGLRFRTNDTLIELTAEARGHQPVSFHVVRIGRTSGGGSRARLLDGTLAGQRVFGANASISVTRGASITGIVQMQYSAPWPTASVWAAMTPTWGDARTVGHDVTPVATPVNEDVVDLPVDVVAPDSAGHFWLLFAVDAEPSGGFVLSRSNWTLNTPRWGDGNDLASLSDSVIRLANRDGWVGLPKAYDARLNTAALCLAWTPPVPNTELRYCMSALAMFGVEVVVR